MQEKSKYLTNPSQMWQGSHTLERG